MKKLIRFLFVALAFVSVLNARPSQARWMSYGERYAVIVMGTWYGTQDYIWYWSNTFEMYTELKELGFTDENIYFLASGDSVAVHPGVVDTTNATRSSLEWAFGEVGKRSSSDDLVYIWWVDHGLGRGFVLPLEHLLHSDYARMIEDIAAKQIIGAYHPCQSGAVIDDVSRIGVTSITSTRADEANFWGWAEAWRQALRGGTPDDPADNNRDGYICMSEAYEWTAIRAHEHGEHPQFDDNGDGVGHGLGSAGYDLTDPTKDGYIGSKYSLTGWWSGESAVEISTASISPPGFALSQNFPNPFNRETIIHYALPQASNIRFEVYDVVGRKVETLLNGRLAAGRYIVHWDGRDEDGKSVGSGIYLYRLETGNFIKTRKALLLR